jgi:hypothetical protein
MNEQDRTGALAAVSVAGSQSCASAGPLVMRVTSALVLAPPNNSLKPWKVTRICD